MNHDKFYYTFLDPRITKPQKFTDCDCKIISVENGKCLVEGCESHKLSITRGTIKYISLGPAVPKEILE